MRIALLAAPHSWYRADLERAAGDAHTITTLPFSRIKANITGANQSTLWEPSPTATINKPPQVSSSVVESSGHCLNDFDTVLVRTMPPGSLEQVVFRMDALARLEAAGTRVLNPPKAIEAAVDKYLSLAKLAAAGLDVPRTYACQTRDDALEAFAKLGGRAVLKPIFGGEGRGVSLLTDVAMAHRAFSLLEQLGAVIYLQEFIETKSSVGAIDWRLLVIGDRVLGMARTHEADWRTNISLGGHAGPLEVTPELAELAHRAAAAIGAPLCGVDIAPTPDGRHVVLEVNAVPGWRALTRVTAVNVARLVLDL